MSIDVRRHYVTLTGRWGERQVHYRRAGSGPTVLLLHQSPQSSREMAPLMQQWGRHFTLIAPDTPGYGQSDPLGPDEVPLEDFADAVVEFADAIGLRRFGIYGFHTGGSIGSLVAHRHPSRVAALASNGYILLTEAERGHMLAVYLPPLVPRWDGGHLAWLWGRMREQTIFFPWHDARPDNRMDFDMPEPAGLQAGLLEFLRAGEHYHVAYRAALDYDGGPVLAELQVPTLLTAAAWDPLARHLGRIGARSDAVQVQQAGERAEAVALCLQHLLLHPADPCPAAPATREPTSGPGWRMLHVAGHDHLRVRTRLGGAGGRPLVLVHDAGGSSDTVERLLAPLAGQAPVVSLDLPGHGESDPAGHGGHDAVHEAADAVRATVHELGLGDPRLAGVGCGAVVALAARAGDPRPGGTLLLCDVPWLEDADRTAFLAEGLPDTTPVWHGGHLLLQWHLLRDGRMFFPWFRRNRQGMRRVEYDLDDRRLHLEFRELLKASGAWQRLLADTLGAPLAAALANAPAGTRVAAARDSAWWLASRQAANAAPGLRFTTLPADPCAWLPALLRAD
jgi:haloalkane dehalogenase